MRTFALVLATGIAVAGGAGAALAQTVISESGSSLLFPLMNDWSLAYKAVHPEVRVVTQSSGSGAGVAQAVAGLVRIGASDVFQSDEQIGKTKMLNIPLVVSAQQIVTNVPELHGQRLKLSATVLAGIYGGKIAFWNDAAIAELNPTAAAQLPHRAIVPIHRADKSGDTALFTEYLSASAPAWKSGPGVGQTVTWPDVPKAVDATGNPGMIRECERLPYSIAYVGLSFLEETAKAGLQTALLQNAAGGFVAPNGKSIAAAALAFEHRTPPDERISLVNAPGADSYPIVNYEYAVVNPHQPDATTASYVKGFLSWAVASDGGSATRLLQRAHFIALPPPITELSKKQIEDISY